MDPIETQQLLEKKTRNEKRLRFCYQNTHHPGISEELTIRKNTIDDAITEDIFSGISFPDGTILRSSKDIHEYLLHPFQDKSDSRVDIVATSFWRKFNAEYLSLLDKLATDIAPFLADTDLVVSISARNELSIDKAIHKYVSSNPSVMKKMKVVFVINDNYQSSDVVIGQRRASLEHTSSLFARLKQTPHFSLLRRSSLPSQVSIVISSVQLPEYANAGLAKKVGIETLIRAMGKIGHYCPIQSLDADTSGYTTQDYQIQALEQLSTPNTLAVSSNYTYDEESQAQYPAWKLRCQLLERVNDILSEEISNRLIGASFLIEPLSYMLIGGYSPQFAEDAALGNSLKQYFSFPRWFGYQRLNPIAKTGTIRVSSSKEMENIKSGELPESHWIRGEEYFESFQTTTAHSPSAHDNPLLSKSLNAESITFVVNSIYEYLLKSLQFRHRSAKVVQFATIILCKTLSTFPNISRSVNIEFSFLNSSLAKYNGNRLIQEIAQQYSLQNPQGAPEIIEITKR